MTDKVLGVLDVDDLAPELQSEYKNYGVMFTQLLGPLSDEWQIESYRVVDGQWPESMAECSAYLITGSKAGVYETHSWLVPLRKFIQDAYVQAVPFIGICFGHQILADTLGGRAAKSEKGWGIGLRTVFARTLPEWMTPQPVNLNLLYSHQDQVLAIPEGSTLLFGDDFCPNAAFHEPGRILAFQGHPEFTKPYLSKLMSLRKDRYAPGQYESGLNSMDIQHDGALVGHWIFQFLDDCFSEVTS